MKIIERYITVSLFRSFLLSLLVLLVIFFFFRFLSELDNLERNYGLIEAIIYCLILIPAILKTVVPLSILIGAASFIGLMFSNNEMHIIQSGTISPKKVIKLVLKFAIFLFLFSFVITEISSPVSNKTANTYRNYQLGKPVADYSSNNFWIKNSNQFIFFGDKNSENTFNDFKILVEIPEDNLTKILFSSRGEITDNSLILENVKEVAISNLDDLPKPKEAKSPQVKYMIDFDKEGLDILNQKVEELSFFEIVSQLFLFSSIEKNTDSIKFEIVKRLIHPLSFVLTILLVVPMLFRHNRSSSAMKSIFNAILLALTVHLLNKISTVVSMKIGFDLLFIGGLILLSIILLGIMRIRRVNNF